MNSLKSIIIPFGIADTVFATMIVLEFIKAFN